MNNISEDTLADILERGNWHDRDKNIRALFCMKPGRHKTSDLDRRCYLQYNRVLFNSFSRKRTKTDEYGDL